MVDIVLDAFGRAGKIIEQAVGLARAMDKGRRQFEMEMRANRGRGFAHKTVGSYGLDNLDEWRFHEQLPREWRRSGPRPMQKTLYPNLAPENSAYWPVNRQEL
jgi:hypothetical protein